jgi:molybdopterin adenylyltransferase
VKILVITISDRASRGEYEDRSGERIREILREEFTGSFINKIVVPDEKDEIWGALEKGKEYDCVITTGGTGIGPRDITPEVTLEFIEKELPGIAEVLRQESYKETPQAMLSRGVAGLFGKTIIVNFPGSLKAVDLCTRLILPIIPHAKKMLLGEGH